jgi:hypothetical protein
MSCQRHDGHRAGGGSGCSRVGQDQLVDERDDGSCESRGRLTQGVDERLR